MLGDSIEFTPERDASPCKVSTIAISLRVCLMNMQISAMRFFIDEKLKTKAYNLYVGRVISPEIV